VLLAAAAADDDDDGHQTGQWEAALDLLNEMKAQGIQANEVTYSILFDVLAAAGQWQRALHLFMTLDREGKQAEHETG
jgi:pentatricopeptide repeat protein